MMKKTLIDFASERGLISPGDRVLVALSGGADSVSLLSALFEARGELGIELEAAHFDHNLRMTSNRDAAFCRDICNEFGIFLTVGGGDVAREAKRRGGGIEETARRMRYDFLEETRSERGMSSVATAHTADDELETIILNLIRGGGMRGLTGIPPRRGRIIRPMLTVTRAAVEEYLSGRGLKHVEDETNASEEYGRNRIRLRVAPVLRELNPRAPENAAKAALRLLEDEEFLQSLASDFIDNEVYRYKESSALSAAALNALPRPVAVRVLRGLTGAWMESVHADTLISLSSCDNPSARVSLPNGNIARREYGKLVFEKEKPEKTFSETPITVPGTTNIPDLGLRIECKVQKMDEKIHNSVNIYYLRHDIIMANLTLRPRREGDYIRLCGRPKKSLKKLFIEAKIPAHERAAVPVLADERGVVAVFGLGPDEQFIPRAEDTHVIEVYYEKGH